MQLNMYVMAMTVLQDLQLIQSPTILLDPKS